MRRSQTFTGRQGQGKGTITPRPDMAGTTLYEAFPLRSERTASVEFDVAGPSATRPPARPKPENPPHHSRRHGSFASPIGAPKQSTTRQARPRRRSSSDLLLSRIRSLYFPARQVRQRMRGWFRSDSYRPEAKQDGAPPASIADNVPYVTQVDNYRLM